VDAVVDSPSRLSRVLNQLNVPLPTTTSQGSTSEEREGAEHKTKCRALLDQGSITVEEYRELVLVGEHAAMLSDQLQLHASGAEGAEQARHRTASSKSLSSLACTLDDVQSVIASAVEAISPIVFTRNVGDGSTATSHTLSCLPLSR
jgi:hypothetical protein